ncbi:MAG: hypothetical protein HC914_16210 [Chloroflexaceae bacterium]|nr:hypothetical protein [Chloroflexaceae bacterium]
MNSEIIAALTVLGLTVIGSLSTLVKVLTDRITAGLEENTRLTEQARDAANGQLRKVLEELARERNTVVGLRVLLRERDDRLGYIAARHPEVQNTLKGYRERRQRLATEHEEAEALTRFLEDDPDDPTGTDAGAYPNG